MPGVAAFAVVALCAAQSLAVAVTGTVRDASGGVVPGATVELVSGGSRAAAPAITDARGAFSLPDIPAGRHRLRVTMPGFSVYEDAIVHATETPANVDVVLALSRLEEQVSVRGAADPVVPVAGSRVAVDRQLIEDLPSESVNSGLSSLIVLTSPGVAADSNGVFHPLGEHAETTIAIDNQPISDQQSRIFSNQLSPNAIESMEVLVGIPPPEFGDKTSLVANVTTRSGLALHRIKGSVSAAIGSFETRSASVSLGGGSDRFGNFIAIDRTGSARFLDTPEPEPLHAQGDVVNLFDRFDYLPSPATRVQVNIIAGRSQFETPNTYDQQHSGQDQRQHQWTSNLAGTFGRVFGTATALETNAWFRHDRVSYIGSENPFADQPATLAQTRTLTNAGARATLSYAVGSHVVKGGVQTTSTWLKEQFHTGVTSPAFNSPCFTPEGDPSPDTSVRDPGVCARAGLTSNQDFLPALLPFDLTRAGALFEFAGTARVDQGAAYLQDSMRFGHWTAMAGARLDVYSGLTTAVGIQPRGSVAYRADRTNTTWRAAYGRFFLTPYNENLVLASTTGTGGLGGGELGSVGGAPLVPARRDQYDVGFEQVWRRVRVSGGYFWKRTDGAFDFDVILNTPLTFPVQFRRAEVDGGLLRVTLAEIRGFSAYTTASHTESRLFGPELGGLRFSASYAPIARPDHDEPLQETTHVEYRARGAAGLWMGMTWRYDSGLVAVSVPSFADALRLTGDQQAAMGLFCGGTFATVDRPIRSCADSAVGSTRIVIPPAGAENDDTNPSRIRPHHLFDIGVGVDALAIRHTRLRARVTVVNAFNATALYNFLSTFAGTHFVTPRSLQTELTFQF